MCSNLLVLLQETIVSKTLTVLKDMGQCKMPIQIVSVCRLCKTFVSVVFFVR